MCSTLAPYTMSMQQYAAKKDFFDNHPFWVNSAYKNIPDSKFLAEQNYLIRKNPYAAYLTLYAASMQQYTAKNFFF